jgi:alkylation response protein AidB-like acyl-CoA dehydrogenase
VHFKLTEEQMEIKRAARKFAKKSSRRTRPRIDRRGEFPPDLHRKAAKLGLTGMRIPEEYGGQGYGVLEECLVVKRALPC